MPGRHRMQVLPAVRSQETEVAPRLNRLVCSATPSLRLILPWARSFINEDISVYYHGHGALAAGRSMPDESRPCELS